MVVAAVLASVSASSLPGIPLYWMSAPLPCLFVKTLGVVEELPKMFYLVAPSRKRIRSQFSMVCGATF